MEGLFHGKSQKWMITGMITGGSPMTQDTSKYQTILLNIYQTLNQTILTTSTFDNGHELIVLGASQMWGPNKCGFLALGTPTPAVRRRSARHGASCRPPPPAIREVWPPGRVSTEFLCVLNQT